MKAIQQLLRTYRNEIKGVAILWVVFFHAQLGLSGAVYDVQKIGYGGVDMFFFLSGFGLYYSLKRDADLGKYALRRAQRLLPSYLPFCLVWLAVMIPLTRPGMAAMIRMVTGNLFMIGSFSGAPVVINWYVSALVISLVLAPFFYATFAKAKNVLLSAVALIGGCFLAGLAMIGHDLYATVSRLPVFALGMAVGAWKAERPAKKAVLAAGALALPIGLAVLLICFQRFPELLNDYAMYWHPFFLIAPALCIWLSQMFSLLPSKGLAPVRLLGEASFEIFLCNVWVELLGKRYGLCSGAGEWIVWSVASVAAGVLYHLAVKWTLCKISKKT